ncbi:MAG: UPF0175 family protein [Caldilineaceae bacterium]|nr:UPF0175 family protein [Caldilineaceae bacterium]
MTILTKDTATGVAIEDSKADWLLVFEAALRVGEFSSFDELLLRALDAWLEQLPVDLRWKIAIELYSNDRISTGRAAEIAGLNYVIFMEMLREHGIPFMAAKMTDDAEREREEALLDELLSI